MNTPAHRLSWAARVASSGTVPETMAGVWDRSEEAGAFWAHGTAHHEEGHGSQQFGAGFEKRGEVMLAYPRNTS